MSRILQNLPVAIQTGGDIVANAAKGHAPVKSGTLRDSIQTREIKVDGLTASGKVGPSDDVPYAKIQDKGGFVPADAEYIEPVKKKALAFGGKVYKRVKRHFIPAHPYMDPAVEETREIAKQAMKGTVLAGIK